MTKYPPLTAHGLAALGLALLLSTSVWWAQRTLGDGVLPHGYCLTWIPGLLWLHVVSDSLIALAYLSIPITLLYFVRRRADVPFGWMVVLFGAFIVACGATHAFDVWTLWNPDYWLSGGVKALTAGISVMSAFALVGVIPKALAMPSLEQLQAAKRSLEQEIERRLAVEAELRAAKEQLERRVAERTAQLSKARSLLDAVIDAAPVGIAILDDEQRYVRVNVAMARLNGIAVDQHVGRRLGDVVPGVAPAVVEHLQEIRRSGAPLIGMELTGHTAGSGANATFRISYFSIRVAAGEAPLIGAICEDISERRASEAERARLLQQAEAANRLKDEFMARVSHELRTPLQALMSWTTLLRLGALEPERRRHAIDRIDHNVRLQARMISDLLDISRILSGTLDLQWSRVDPADVVGRALEGFAATARARSIALEWAADPSAAGTLVTDPQRLEQVANNLVGNALKFTPSGGRVAVRARGTPTHWTLEVRDDGIGLDPDDLPALFTPFRRGAARSPGGEKGLGLGLAICRHIVELLGGTIGAASDGPGRGASFVVTLPRGRVPDVVEATPSGAAEAGAAARLDGTRVLFVEDDPDTLEAMVQALTQLGAAVLAAANPEEAERLARTSAPDVLVTDLQLGAGRSGFDVLREVRQLRPALPALVVSAFGADRDRHATAAAGFDGHLVKPLDAAAIAAAIHALRMR